MKTTLRLAQVALFGSLGLAGCSNAPAHVANLDDTNEPLTSYSAVFANTPANESIALLKADTILPSKYTGLLTLQSPVRNQAHRGDCTIFSTVGLMEHLYTKAGFANPDFSEQYLQWATKVQYGAYPTGEGSNNDVNIDTINQFGIVDEATDPYNPDEWDESNDPACISGQEDGLPTRCYTQGDPTAAMQAATKYTLPPAQYLNASTTNVKTHLFTQQTDVVVGIDFFYQAWNHRLSTLPVNNASFGQGIVLYPNADDISESHKQRAGHGILLVGWDDDLQFPKVDKTGAVIKDASGQPVMEKGFYIFKNSWGTTRFGVSNPYGAGYGFISYRYIAAFATANVTTVPTLN